VRVVVVGASSGLGRGGGLGRAGRGARGALLARRRDRLERAAAEAGDDAVAIACDVTDEASVAAGVDQAATSLGGIDGVVYCTAVMTVDALRDVSAERWQAAFASNVTGAAVVTAAALPHLQASGGSAVYFSSISASLTPAWPVIGAYAATKAALDKMVDAWRVEHPDVGFTRLAVGDCAGGSGESGTEFGKGEDLATFTAGLEEWLRRGYVTGDLIDPEDLVHVIDAVLRLGPSASIPQLTITPRAKAGTL
jgi:NAD(P)-dependent dehydrogenase (short-subunit alcohol dehydrogenase family)